jgi:hypothetical protein
MWRNLTIRVALVFALAMAARAANCSGQTPAQRKGLTTMRSTLALALFVFVVGFGTSARAQILGLTHVWTVPGAMQTGGCVGTFVMCTNGSTAATTVGVEMFGPVGNALGNAVTITVAPNASVMFGTGLASAISIDGNLATGVFTRGHARVYAQSPKGIMCAAYLAEECNNTQTPGSAGTPTMMVSLPVIKKTSQKGD